MSCLLTTCEAPQKIAAPPPDGPWILSGVWKGVRGWLFDLDEMLYDTTRHDRISLKRTARFLAAHLGLDTRVAAAVAERIADVHSGDRAVTELCASLGLDGRWHAPARDVYQQSYAAIAPRQGVPELFHILHEEYRVGMLVGRSRPEGDDILDELGLTPFVDVSIRESTLDPELTRSNPELFRWAASAMGLDPHAVAFVSDVIEGPLEAAYYAGMATVLVADGRRTGGLSRPRALGPDAVVGEVPELIALLVQSEATCWTE
jgi:phosphoglycolate phosphatase-like HAD superfamily hydrolase